MICKNCSSEIADNAKFCPNCGAAVVREEAVSEVNMVEEATTAETLVEQAPANEVPVTPVVAVPMPEPAPQTAPQPMPEQQTVTSTYAPQQSYAPQQNYVPQQNYARSQVKIPPANYAPPAEYKPISAWGYIGWNILFAIPVVGWILILIFGLGGTKNVNLKNYARSFLIVFLIGVGIVALIFVAIFILSIIMGASMSTYTY